MPEPDPKIAELEARLDRLVRTQIDFQTEISTIRAELSKLRGAVEPVQPTHPMTTPLDEPTAPPPYEPLHQRSSQPYTSANDTSRTVPPSPFGARSDEPKSDSSPKSESAFSNYVSAYAESARADLEKFIGENLISKIGIVILVLGVGIGAKYAIDNGWISPLMRIVFGYAMGVGLIGFAVRLKAKYLSFSAVLLSGGMAIMYFVTYFAYAYYALIPQSAAYALMAIFTVFTVASAILYNRQVIAHIGLVGAYAVPFLLSNNSGNYLFLFTYMAIINAGILAISVRKYWKPLFYTSFLFTWLIYYMWFVTKYSAGEHFYLALTFASIFFAIFYATTIVRGAFSKDGEKAENALGLLLTSFVFYGFGYAIIDSREDWRGLAGAFTLVNSGFHLLTAQAVSRFRPLAVSLVQVLTIMVVTFATISIPVQFDGNTITLIWTVEAVALFWFGRARQERLFEYFSYPLMVLATGSLFIDWITAYGDRWSYVSQLNLRPLANGNFATALVFVTAFGFIYLVNRNREYLPAITSNLVTTVGVIVAAVALVVLYNAFRIEISNYFHVQIARNETLIEDGYVIGSGLPKNHTLFHFNTICQINYTMFFLAALAVANLRKARSLALVYANVTFGLIILLIFATVGMSLLYELRLSYMDPEGGSMLGVGPLNIGIRYISYAFAAMSLYTLFEYSRDELITDSFPAKSLELGFDSVFHITIFIAASCELVNLMGQFQIADSTKLGLSILWGVYALTLIVIGIAKNKKHLRIAAIVLLAVTLVKLFLYDIADLPTIPKTILFVSLGLLMLIVSFLYNKYKGLIFKSGAVRSNNDEPLVRSKLS